MPAAQEVVIRKGREGARWINERPSSEEFAAWFAASVKIDPKLKAEDYVGGIVLIPAVDEKAKVVTGFAANGAPIIVQRPEMAYIPYAKVETRIAYFWDWVGVHEDWIGVIEPVVTERPDPAPLGEVTETVDANGKVTSRTTTYRQPANAAIIQQLPPGFFLLPVPMGAAYTHFLCCSYRVAIYRRGEGSLEHSIPLREGRGTKMVPLLLGRDTKYPDVNAIMKAETGAIGRAIGFAGVFIIPGSGVATAEDMLESLAQAPTATSDPSAEGGAGPEAPAQPPVRTPGEVQAATDEELFQRAVAMRTEMEETHPDAWQAFGRWCHERRPPITSLQQKGPAMRGLIRKMETLLEAARAVAATEGGTDGPAGDREAPGGGADRRRQPALPGGDPAGDQGGRPGGPGEPAPPPATPARAAADDPAGGRGAAAQADAGVSAAQESEKTGEST